MASARGFSAEDHYLQLDMGMRTWMLVGIGIRSGMGTGAGFGFGIGIWTGTGIWIGSISGRESLDLDDWDLYGLDEFPVVVFLVLVGVLPEVFEYEENEDGSENENENEEKELGNYVDEGVKLSLHP